MYKKIFTLLQSSLHQLYEHSVRNRGRSIRLDHQVVQPYEL